MVLALLAVWSSLRLQIEVVPNRWTAIWPG